jgi:hypothetical protein
MDFVEKNIFLSSLVLLNCSPVYFYDFMTDISLYILLAGLYLLWVLILTALASKRRMGCIRAFFVSLILTPIVGTWLLILSRPVEVLKFVRFRCIRCGVDFTENLHDCPYCKKEGIQTSLTRIDIHSI